MPIPKWSSGCLQSKWGEQRSSGPTLSGSVQFQAGPLWMWRATILPHIHSGSTCPWSWAACGSRQSGWLKLARCPIKLIYLGSSSNNTPTLDNLDNPFLLIIDSTGLPSLPVISCSCPTADAADELFLDLELLPASYESIKTAFTFHCLDNYRTSNLECRTSAYQYYQKLQQLTNPVFPQAMLNRYNEFCWVTQQWRNLKLKKWFGFGHHNENPGKGSLSLFCPACPQPSVSLPTDFKSWYTEYVAHWSYVLFSINFLSGWRSCKAWWLMGTSLLITLNNSDHRMTFGLVTGKAW